jgi:hypothetical protein
MQQRENLLNQPDISLLISSRSIYTHLLAMRTFVALAKGLLRGAGHQTVDESLSPLDNKMELLLLKLQKTVKWSI